MRVFCPVPPRPTQGSPGTVPDEGAALAHTVPGTGRPSIGVLDDHLDPPFMDELVARLQEGLGGVDIRVWIKPLGTAPAPDDIILEMAEEVRLALVGVGL